MKISVQAEQFDMGAETNAFIAAQNGMGAIVTFSGIVRDLADNPMRYMEIEHYPGMTEKAIGEIVKGAVSRWSLGDARVLHRYGRLYVGEPIMMVATSAPHRVDAFEAAEFLMDYLKSRAPFWKKEVTQNDANWVDAKNEDEEALNRW